MKVKQAVKDLKQTKLFYKFIGINQDGILFSSVAGRAPVCGAQPAGQGEPNLPLDCIPPEEGVFPGRYYYR